MASSSFSQFLPFLSPTKPPPAKSPPSSQLFPLSPSSSSSSNTSQFPSLSFSLPNPQGKTITDENCSAGGGDITAMGGSVVCPSLAYANTLYFNSAYNVQVVVGEDEPEERLLNRFRREVMKVGVIQECKRRQFFENKQDEKKRKSREAAKRNSRRRRPQSRGGSTQVNKETSKAKKDDEDEDNWEMPEGGLPF